MLRVSSERVLVLIHTNWNTRYLGLFLFLGIAEASWFLDPSEVFSNFSFWFLWYFGVLGRLSIFETFKIPSDPWFSDSHRFLMEFFNFEHIPQLFCFRYFLKIVRSLEFYWICWFQEVIQIKYEIQQWRMRIDLWLQFKKSWGFDRNEIIQVILISWKDAINDCMHWDKLFPIQFIYFIKLTRISDGFCWNRPTQSKILLNVEMCKFLVFEFYDELYWCYSDTKDFYDTWTFNWADMSIHWKVYFSSTLTF